MKITIHANPVIQWQARRQHQFEKGLVALGFEPTITTSRRRISDAPAILFGTSFWKDIEAAEGDWLLVDRASYGDPDYVQLGWNGHLRRGDHKIPSNYLESPRWAPTREPQVAPGRRVLCGQYQPHSPTPLADWYATRAGDATHYKPHPAISVPSPVGDLPLVYDFDQCSHVYTLNSSVAIECLFNGMTVDVDDEGAMAYEFAQGNMDWNEWIAWLSWTQWRWDEIEQGKPIEHLFEWLR